MKKIFAILLSVLISACSLGLVACDAQANSDAKFTIATIYNLLKEEGWDGTITELTEIFQGKEISNFEITPDGKLFVIYEDGTVQQVGGHNLILDFIIKKPTCGQKGYGYYKCVGHCSQQILAIIDPANQVHDFGENGFCPQCMSYIGEVATRKVCENAYLLERNDGFFDLYLIGDGAVDISTSISEDEAQCVKGLFIGKGVSDLGEQNFEQFDKLENIFVHELNEYYYSSENALYNKLNDELIKECVSDAQEDTQNLSTDQTE